MKSYMHTILVVIFAFFAGLSLQSVKSAEALDSATRMRVEKYSELAKEFRQKAVSDQEYLYKFETGIGDLKMRRALRVNSLRRRFFGSTITALGCMASERPLVGFYDVTRHVWLMVWFNTRTDTVESFQFSSGLEPTSQPEGTAWYDIFEAEGGTIVDALSKSLKIQMESFVLLSQKQGCQMPFPHYAEILNANQGAANLIESELKIAKFNQDIIKKINDETASDLSKGKELSPILSSIISNEDFILSIHSVRKQSDDKLVLLLKQWKRHEGEVELNAQFVWPK